MVSSILIGMLVMFLFFGIPFILVSIEQFSLAIIWCILALGAQAGIEQHLNKTAPAVVTVTVGDE